LLLLVFLMVKYYVFAIYAYRSYPLCIDNTNYFRFLRTLKKYVHTFQTTISNGRFKEKWASNSNGIALYICSLPRRYENNKYKFKINLPDYSDIFLEKLTALIIRVSPRKILNRQVNFKNVWIRKVHFKMCRTFSMWTLFYFYTFFFVWF